LAKQNVEFISALQLSNQNFETGVEKRSGVCWKSWFCDAALKARALPPGGNSRWLWPSFCFVAAPSSLNWCLIICQQNV
jgi:hypothetical protein